jgi:hypothetical protein
VYALFFKNLAHTGKKYIQVSVEESEQMRPLERFEDNIKMDMK